MRLNTAFCCVLLLTGAALLPGCVNTSNSSEKTVTRDAPVPAHTVSKLVRQSSEEAQVKPAPEPAPPAAAPPANLVVTPPATPEPARPASPEEQTKKTLEPKAVPTAAPPQPRSEPLAAEPEAEAPKPAVAPADIWQKEGAPQGAAAEKEQTPPPGQAEKPASPEAPATSEQPAEATAEKAPAKVEPASVAVVGDSLAVGIGMTMSQRLKKYEGVACYPLGKVSTGLINKRFFDWEKKLSELVAKEKVSAMVVMMGGNDANNAIGGKRAGTPEWGDAYREKAEDFLRIAAKAGVKIYWVGLPAMRDAAYNTRVEAVNAAAKNACEHVGGCVYMEASTIFTDTSGKYVQSKSIDGKKVSLRAKDGVHMTMNGYDLLCRQVLDKLTASGELPPRN